MAKKSNLLTSKNILIYSLGLVVVLGGIWLLFRNPANKGSGVIPSTSPVQTPTTSDKIGTTGDQASSASSNSSTDKTNAASGEDLAVPYGTFISNHRPNLSGTPAPSSEVSVCNTTPGASCYLKFTKGDVVKTLATQTVDSSGSTYWNWDVTKAGFTPGSWQITAIASFNGQTKTTTDPLSLEVTQ